MPDEQTKIMVLDRGFVIVGKVRMDELAYHWRISPGRTIRVWGTKNGLTELCAGPRKETVLDPIAHESVPFRAVLRIIDASEDGWRKTLQE